MSYSGYMSPEYALDGFFSIKSDVFSFGVILLEIISGKRNTIFYKSGQAFNLDVPFVDLECILAATDNFSDANKLGKGGFGPVYKVI